jgi:DNA-directed RNA polymerase specialized sigma24 family protein
MCDLTVGRANEFRVFVEAVEARLRRAFFAAYGEERGAESLAEALAYAWEHWDMVQSLANPAGYLYRVGQSRTRPRLRPANAAFPPLANDPWVEPGLPAALGSLTARQRVAVVLIEGFGWSAAEVGELAGLSESTVRKHFDRGMTKLRKKLGVVLDG